MSGLKHMPSDEEEAKASIKLKFLLTMFSVLTTLMFISVLESM